MFLLLTTLFILLSHKIDKYRRKNILGEISRTVWYNDNGGNHLALLFAFIIKPIILNLNKISKCPCSDFVRYISCTHDVFGLFFSEKKPVQFDLLYRHDI